MTRHRRISLALAAAATVSTALLGPAAAAAGTATAAAASAPGAGVSATEWRFIGKYVVSSLCAAAGQAGIQNGDWDRYLCLPRMVGLDILYYSLYVSP